MARLLDDQYTTDLAAGAVNGTAAEPGPGTRTVVDTAGLLSISGGKLTIAGCNANYDPRIYYGSFARAAGRVMAWQFNSGIMAQVGQFAGWENNTTSPTSLETIYSSSAVLYAYRDPGLFVVLPSGEYQNNTVYDVAIVLRAAGCFYVGRGGVLGDAWKLLAIGYFTTTPVYPMFSPYTSTYDGTRTIDNLRVADLPAPWNSDYGIATQRLAGARSAGDTFTHEADCLIEWIVTTRADGQQLAFRAQDANNCWRVDVAADGSISLQEIVSGGATSRGTGAAGSIANGQRMVIIADGSVIKVYANSVLKITYSSATNFATCTAGSLIALGTGGAVSDIVSWPRALSGTAKTALDELSGLYVQSLTGAVTPAGGIARLVDKALAGAVSFAGSAIRLVDRALAGAVSFAGAVGKGLALSLDGVVTFVSVINRHVSRSLAGGLGFLGWVYDGPFQAKILNGLLSFLGVLAGKFFRVPARRRVASAEGESRLVGYLVENRVACYEQE